MTPQLTYAGWIAAAGLGLVIYLSWYRRSQHLHRNEQLVLSRARQKAGSIVAQARDQAMDILASSKISAGDDKSRLEEQLNKISAEQLREFKETVANISKDIEIDALKEVEEFKKAMEIETVLSQKIVAEQIQHKRDEVEAELDQYKLHKMQELDKQIVKIVGDVIRQVAGKVIPITEHEQLILKVLQEAKTKDVF